MIKLDTKIYDDFEGLSLKSALFLITPPKFNMEPENQPLEKEVPIGNHHFQVPC